MEDKLRARRIIVGMDILQNRDFNLLLIHEHVLFKLVQRDV
jgi:hypothetical protein